MKEGFHLHVTTALKDPNSHVRRLKPFFEGSRASLPWSSALHSIDFCSRNTFGCSQHPLILLHALPATDAPWEVCTSGGGRLAAAGSHANTGACTVFFPMIRNHQQGLSSEMACTSCELLVVCERLAHACITPDTR